MTMHYLVLYAGDLADDLLDSVHELFGFRPSLGALPSISGRIKGAEIVETSKLLDLRIQQYDPDARLFVQRASKDTSMSEELALNIARVAVCRVLDSDDLLRSVIHEKWQYPAIVRETERCWVFVLTRPDGLWGMDLGIGVMVDKFTRATFIRGVNDISNALHLFSQS